MHAVGITAEEKRRALQEVLGSLTFRRADQLRQFLEFVVEEEIAGRGAQIREIDVAVRALGRPASYSPETDSTVRTRAHALRQRLGEYYESEAPQSEIRIELPKGGYTPRFVRLPDTLLEPASESRIALPEVPAVTAPPAPVGRTKAWVLVLAGAVLGALLCGSIITLLAAKKPAAELRGAWGPILSSRTPVRVIMSSPPQIWVRDYGTLPTPLVDPVESPPMPDDPHLLRWYGEHMLIRPDSKLYLHANSAGALWGDAAGVQVATRFLTENGVRCELVPEKSLKSGYVFRNDSYLAFGRSEYSPLMSGKIPNDGFDVLYIPSIRRHGIARRANPDAGPKYLPTVGGTATNYGLVTIIRDRADDGHPCQAMFFAGVISNGAQAAIEYMTTPRHLKELEGRLRREGLDEWPKVMQVVVRSETAEFYPLRTGYETHLVLKR